MQDFADCSLGQTRAQFDLAWDFELGQLCVAVAEGMVLMDWGRGWPSPKSKTQASFKSARRMRGRSSPAFDVFRIFTLATERTKF